MYKSKNASLLNLFAEKSLSAFYRELIKLYQPFPDPDPLNQLTVPGVYLTSWTGLPKKADQLIL